MHAFKKEFDWRLEVAYMAAMKLVRIQEEQGKILEKIKKLDKVEVEANKEDAAIGSASS